MISSTGQRRGINSHRQLKEEPSVLEIGQFSHVRQTSGERQGILLTSYLSSPKKLCRCFGPFQGCLSPLKVGVIGPDKIITSFEIFQGPGLSLGSVNGEREVEKRAHSRKKMIVLTFSEASFCSCGILRALRDLVG